VQTIIKEIQVENILARYAAIEQSLYKLKHEGGFAATYATRGSGQTLTMYFFTVDISVITSVAIIRPGHLCTTHADGLSVADNRLLLIAFSRVSQEDACFFGSGFCI